MVKWIKTIEDYPEYGDGRRDPRRRNSDTTISDWCTEHEFRCTLKEQHTCESSSVRQATARY